jgi:hypothetical protein
MKSVAIIDGFAEGKWHHKLLRKELEHAGFATADSTETADIIMAHSAGCFFLPVSSKPQLIILIGPPYWPGRPLIVSMFKKIYLDFIYRLRERKLGYWLIKTFWNTVYIFGDLQHVIHVGRFARKRDLLDRLKNKEVVLIRNEDDAWCTPDLKNIPFKNKSVEFYALPGEHDDCWVNPQPYAKILTTLVSN